MLTELVIFVIALLPVIILGYYIYSKDREKEPIKILLLLFFGGLLSALLTLGISYVIQKLFPSIFYYKDSNTLFLFIYTFLCVSLVEEFSKFIITYLFSYNNKEYDQFYDMIVYSVFVALGFAWIENLLYIYEGGIYVALLRSLVAVPTHVCVAIFMGYYLSLAKLADLSNIKGKKSICIAMSILIPTLFHGIYDFLIYSSNYFCIYLYHIFIILLFILSYKRLKSSLLRNQKLCTNKKEKIGIIYNKE